MKLPSFSMVRRWLCPLLAAAGFVAGMLARVDAADGPLALSSGNARHQIAELRREIAHHDELYHRKAAPEISDASYDQLKRRLRELERTFPAEAQQVPMLPEIGDDRSGLAPTVRHRERMLSLEKAYTEAELRAFDAGVAKALGQADLAYLIEPKFDGLAVSVTYEKGKLVRAVTRGNGLEGDDVTSHVRQIRGLSGELRIMDDDGRALAVPQRVELRGEIYVAFADFAEINAEREAAGEPGFANPRNLAAGTMRQLDVAEVGRRGLRVVFFGFGACEPPAILPATQQALHAVIGAWGLPALPPEMRLSARGSDGIVRAVENVNRARASFAFPTDGAVVKLDALALQRELGASDTAPRWAIAFKFLPESAETQVRAITLQVGRTGVLTPIAELTPVRLGGSTVTRATLHNRAGIAQLDLRVGDFVAVEKAGEIIPAVTGVNLARRPTGTEPYVFPAACPECRAPVRASENEAVVRCGNAACPAQLRRRLEHFASKSAMNIDGLGPATIEQLVAKGWLKDLPDIYRLRRSDLLTLGRDVEKSAGRLLAEIEASKRAELWRFVHGLGIPQVGLASAKELARRFGTLEALIASAESVTPARDGPTRAAVAYFRVPENRARVNDLLACGVQPTPPAAAGTRLAGKTFALTGTLPGLTRTQVTEKIQAAGGKVTDAVSRSTHYLVAGTEAGAKLAQARSRGVAILDEAGLLRLLGEE